MYQTSKDYYKILEVPYDASSDEIKKAFRKLARRFHPDINKEKDAEEKFKLINEAYENLSDPKKRSQYDRLRRFSQYQQSTDDYLNFDQFINLRDIFNTFFQEDISDFNNRHGQNGEDISLTVDINLDSVLFGGKRNITFNRLTKCEKCKGTGIEDKDSVEICPTCNGYGKVKISQSLLFATFSQISICPDCHGQGIKVKNFCKKCNGDGRYSKKVSLDIDIPVGIKDGQYIKINNYGNDGIGTGKSGNLYIFFNIKDKKIENFKLYGNDLYIKIPISYTLALTGGKIKVPTIRTEKEINIPPMIRPGEIIILKGEGIPDKNNNTVGDLYIEFDIIITDNDKSTKTRIYNEKDQKEPIYKDEIYKEEKSRFILTKEWFDNKVKSSSLLLISIVLIIIIIFLLNFR